MSPVYKVIMSDTPLLSVHEKIDQVICVPPCSIIIYHLLPTKVRLISDIQ